MAANNNKVIKAAEDVKVFPQKKAHIGLCASEDVAGTSGVKYHKDNKPDYVDFKSEVKKEILTVMMDDIDQNDDDSDFDFKKEMESEYSDSEESTNGKFAKTEHEVSDENSDVDQKNNIKESYADFQRIIGKINYSSFTVKEEPVENLKDIFKKSPIKSETEKFHQQIFEHIIEHKSTKINLKDLQAQYIDRLRQVASIEIFSCSLCSYQTMTKINLKCHLFVIHNAKMESDLFKCSRCDYETNFRSYMVRHLPTHSNLKQKYNSKRNKDKYPCPECTYKGRSEDGLRKHMFLHKDKTKCDLCSFESKDKNMLKEHKDTHKEGNRYLCYKCDYKNNNKLVVGIHLLNVHKVANEMSKKSKICEICSHPFSNIYQLQRHYVTHKNMSELSESEIYKCAECGHQTKYKSNFKLHMRMHKPPEFICEICGFSTKHKRSYEHHLITHKRLDEIEWFRCEICPYQARNKKLLYKHMRKGDHSGKKLLHVRNRDRLREAEEKGETIESVIRKYKIKRIGGIKIKRERIVKPSSNPKKKRKSRSKKSKTEKARVEEENVVPLSRIHEVLPEILNNII